MTDYAREKQLAKKREYYRKWRADNPEKVHAAQIRYWEKKAVELRSQESASKKGSDLNERS